MQIRRKSRPSEQQLHIAHSLYSVASGSHDPGNYRSTPLGAPDVAALVRPGMLVRTSYGTGGAVVSVNGPHVYVAPDGREYPHFTIVYVPPDRYSGYTERDLRWINECVAVHGRILMLFEANEDEVFIEDPDVGPP